MGLRLQLSGRWLLLSAAVRDPAAVSDLSNGTIAWMGNGPGR